VSDERKLVECIHGFEDGQCDMCEPPPPGVNTQVFITWGGSHFHNEIDCVSLENGQIEAKDRGDGIHPIRGVPYSSIKLERSPCRTCLPRY
jgi:hypothetical protein